jgi:hypothetical protein
MIMNEFCLWLWNQRIVDYDSLRRQTGQFSYFLTPRPIRVRFLISHIRANFDPGGEVVPYGEDPLYTPPFFLTLHRLWFKITPTLNIESVHSWG